MGAELNVLNRQEVRFGSFAPDDTPTDGHGMSALPPIATELLRRTELTLRALSGCAQLQQNSRVIRSPRRRAAEAGRHVEAERLDQFVFDRRLDRKLARLRAPQDAIDIRRGKLKQNALVISLGQQAAQFSEETPRIYGWQTVTGSQRDDLRTMDVQ